MDPYCEATGRRFRSPEWATDEWELHYKLADLRYWGELVERYGMIDLKYLGHVVLPAGSLEFMPGLRGELPHVVRVSRFHYELARLLHSVSYGDDWRSFPLHFDRTEMVIDARWCRPLLVATQLLPLRSRASTASFAHGDRSRSRST